MMQSNLGTPIVRSAAKREWTPMRLEYIANVGDVMRGATGSRRDTTNCGSRKMNVGTICN